MSRLARWVMNLGVVAIVLGFAKVHARWVADNPYDLTASSRFGWTLAYIGVCILVAYGAGLPDVPRSAQARVGASLGAALASGGFISVAQILSGGSQLPRFVVIASTLILADWYSISTKLAGRDRLEAEERDRVVLVALAEHARSLAIELEESPERAASIVDVLDPDEAAHGGSGLSEAVEAAKATVVVLDRVAQLDEVVIAQVARLHERGVRVRTLSLFYEEWLGKLPVSELERVSLLFDIGEVHRARYGRVKRLLDVSAALCGAVALLLAMPFVLLGNLLGNRGPLLYRQERVGRGGAVFQILKLRTMRDGGSAEWTAMDDARVTRFGRFLRRTHVDELPQVFNILRGELSIVGPRPEQTRYVEELREKLPFYDLRHLVRPGLTGWAQVKYPYGADEVDALEKLQYEFFYLRHQRLGLDLRIVARTVRSVIGRQGR